MKKIFCLAPALVLTLSACDRNGVVDALKNTDTEPVEVFFGISGNGVKSTSVAEDSTGEAKVSGLQFFVFRDGNLDAYKSVQNTTSTTISCTAGPRTVWAFANCPDFSAVTTEAELRAKVSLLASNSTDSFEMSGSKDVEISAGSSVDVEVSRVVSRIVLKKVTADFKSAALSGKTFKINSIYLVNVAAKSDYLLPSDYAPDAFFNLGSNLSGTEEAKVKGLIYDECNSTVSGGVYDTPHYFYAYPNPGTTVSTRLVIEAEIGDEKNYYPITLPALSRNNSYEINELVITRQGSDDPDVPVSFTDVTFSITVNPWNVIPVGNVEGSEGVFEI